MDPKEKNPNRKRNRDKPSQIKLGEAFLRLTNPWLRNSEGDPESNLSDKGKMYIADIRRVLNAQAAQIASIEGAPRGPIFFGKTLDEYLVFIRENVEFEEEYQYIKNAGDEIIMAMLSKKHEPSERQLTLLERLEQMQGNRGKSFSPKPKKE